MIQTVTAWGYFAAWRVLRWLPEILVYSIADKIADSMVRKNGKFIVRFRSNLQRTQPNITPLDLDLLVYKATRSAFRYWCDTFRFPDWSKERILGTVTFNDESILMDAVSAGKGAIVTLPHCGNYDHAAAYFCARGAKIVTVAEHLKPEKLFKKFMQYRSDFGMESLPLDGRVIPTLIQRIRSGCVVALAADRDLSRSGIDVTFFGAPARMPAGPALLAIRTDAPLISAYVSYTEIGIHIDFTLIEIPTEGSETERVAALVQKSADLFAQGIAQHPQDWHMMQRIWIDGDFKDRN
ncbi:MAG: phosphatidylinositol mannoside acyltransferase [Actinomycetales bacterium]|nr:phosphatidylinositol mannoside acyltransferase [Actinomycetales bacterium]